MARTFSDLKTESLGNDFDSALYSTRAGQFLNEALARVSRQVRFGSEETLQTVSTVSGTATYSLAADNVRVRHVFNATTRNMLIPVEQHDIDDADVSSGTPLDYSLEGGVLTLYPTPNGVFSLSVRYRSALGQFSADSDTTATVGFPDAYADVLVSYARHKLYRVEDDPEMANYWLAEFQRQLVEMRADVQLPSEDGPRQVPSMWSS